MINEKGAYPKFEWCSRFGDAEELGRGRGVLHGPDPRVCEGASTHDNVLDVRIRLESGMNLLRFVCHRDRRTTA